MGGVRRVYQRRREYDRCWRHEGLLPPPVSPRCGRGRLGDLRGAASAGGADPLEGNHHEGVRSDGGRALAPRSHGAGVRRPPRQPRADGGAGARGSRADPTPSCRGSRLTRSGCSRIPAGRGRSIRAAWREALGDNDRVGDWIVLFRRRARGASVEDRARGVDRAPLARSRRRGFPRRDPHGPRGAQPRSAGDAGPRSGARRGARVLGRDVQRPAGIRRRPRSRRRVAGPQRRSPPCRSFRGTSRFPTATSPTGSRRSTRFRPSPEWPTPWIRPGTRRRS